MAIATDSFSTVISSEELTQAGIVRISDILTMADLWQTSSLSGFIHQVSVNGLSAFGHEQIAVYLDGQELTPNLLNMVSLESLPLDVSAIDSIVFDNIPKRMGDGALKSGGVINIYSRKRVANIALKLGNETGEPGPYRNTDRKTPNIDTIGPLANLSLAIPLPPYYLNLYANGQIFMFTDQTVHLRNQEILDGVPNVKRWLINSSRPELAAGGILLKPGYTGDLFQIHGVYQESYEDKLMTFFEPVSREIPFDVRRTQMGLSSAIGRANQAWRVQWSLHKKDLRVIERYNSIGFQSDWHFINTRAHVGVAGRWAPLGHIQSGINVEEYQFGYIDSASYAPKKSLVNSIYLNLSELIFWDTPYMIDLNLKAIEGKYYPSILLDLDRDLMEEQLQMALAFSHTQSPSWEQNSLLDPNGGFAEFLEQNSIPENHDQDPGITSRRTTVDFSLSHRINPQSRVGVGTHFRKDRGLSLNILDSVGFIEPGRGFETHYSLVGNSGGSNISVDLVWDFVDQGPITHKVFLSKRWVLNGNNGYQRLYQHIPSFSSRYRINWVVNSRMNICLSTRYKSGSQWEEYRALEGVEWSNVTETQTHSPDIPASLTFDISIRKKFWGDNLDAALIIRNILDEENWLHPIGGEDGRTFYIVLNIHP